MRQFLYNSKDLKLVVTASTKKQAFLKVFKIVKKHKLKHTVWANYLSPIKEGTKWITKNPNLYSPTNQLDYVVLGKSKDEPEQPEQPPVPPEK